MALPEHIADRWTYIQGGFTYIDSNGGSTVPDTTGLSREELTGYINGLPGADDAARNGIMAQLGLTGKGLSVVGLPQSFLIMLECDNAYLSSEPQTPLNSEFGSVAIAMLYRDIAIHCHSTSSLPDEMLRAIADKTGRTPIVDPLPEV